MKKKNIILLAIFIFLHVGCEDVVNVELEESAPRLVVAASLFLPKENPGVSQFIRLTTTATFYSEDVPPATGAEVAIIDPLGRKFDFIEFEPGYYQSDNFTPAFNRIYELEIIYKGELYSAKESLVATPQIEYIEQENDGGFSGNSIELKAFFNDPPGIDNFYLVRFLHNNLSIQIYDDEFTDGNLTFAYFSDSNLKSGNAVKFEIQGISRRFYEYMFILRSQAGAGGGPFQTQPTTVRGNVVNLTNPDNFAFGYFRISETDSFNYIVQ